jgi:hypothetical protein
MSSKTLIIKKIKIILVLTTGHSSSVIWRLEEEICRLEEIKKANIEKFVTNLRNELHRLWDDCYYSEKQRSVTLFFSVIIIYSFYLSLANPDLFSDFLLSFDHCRASGMFIVDPDFSIPDPGSKRSLIRIRNKEFKLCTQIIVTKLSEIRSRIIILDTGSGFFPLRIPDPREKKIAGSRILNTGVGADLQ